MSEQQFQAEVMSQQEQEEILWLENQEPVCLYCGEPKLEKIGCCDENHFTTITD
jgi:hypothetical protein